MIENQKKTLKNHKRMSKEVSRLTRYVENTEARIDRVNKNGVFSRDCALLGLDQYIEESYYVIANQDFDNYQNFDKRVKALVLDIYYNYGQNKLKQESSQFRKAILEYNEIVKDLNFTDSEQLEKLIISIYNIRQVVNGDGFTNNSKNKRKIYHKEKLYSLLKFTFEQLEYVINKSEVSEEKQENLNKIRALIKENSLFQVYTHLI